MPCNEPKAFLKLHLNYTGVLAVVKFLVEGNQAYPCMTSSDYPLKSLSTLGETENEWKKTEQVPIQLPNIARTLFDAKKIIKKKFLAWTSEIIQFIRFENHMDGPG